MSGYQLFCGIALAVGGVGYHLMGEATASAVMHGIMLYLLATMDGRKAR